jgi:hypothetical protein
MVSCYSLPLNKPEELVDQIPRVLRVPTDEQGDEGQDLNTGSTEHMVGYQHPAS